VGTLQETTLLTDAYSATASTSWSKNFTPRDVDNFLIPAHAEGKSIIVDFTEIAYHEPTVNKQVLSSLPEILSVDIHFP
jgi:hypothetical protein